MKVHHDEGVANRIEPEPCGFVREGRSEASVGAHRPAIEPRKALVLDADAVDRAEGDADGRVTASAVNQQRLMRFVEHRVGERIRRLILKWLKAGIPED